MKQNFTQWMCRGGLVLLAAGMSACSMMPGTDKPRTESYPGKPGYVGDATVKPSGFAVDPPAAPTAG